MTCPCGGTYTCDTVTVEVGGYVMTREWSDDYCDRCGKTVGETMSDFEHEVYEEHAWDKPRKRKVYRGWREGMDRFAPPDEYEEFDEEDEEDD